MIEDPLSRSEIEELAEQVGGITNLLSRTSPSYRKLKDSVRSDEEWLDHMVAEPRLIKRPIWIIGRDIVVGFSEPSWQGLREHNL